MDVYKCKMCGGKIIPDTDFKYGICDCCGGKQPLPVALNDSSLMTGLNRANKLRMNLEFDKAYGAYENIIVNNPNEPEAYWGLLLAKYGIEYVDDPNGNGKIPTCNRSSYCNIIDDEDFKKLLDISDVISKDYYLNEANKIAKIQEQILAISKNEQPYDIFICYKQLDENSAQTKDSTIAFEIYNRLIAEGYRVFFAKISLQDKLGVDYESYIFNALNTAKIMIHVTSSKENSNSVWVKNEWSRYLKICSEDSSKLLITCFFDMQPSNLPKALASLQAQDMSKVGAMQDLIFYVKRFFDHITYAEPKQTLNDELNDEYIYFSDTIKGRNDFIIERGTIIKCLNFFDNHLEYRDCKSLKIIAEKMFINKMNSSSDAKLAISFLDDLKDEDDFNELKNTINTSYIKLRKQELIDSEKAPYFGSLYSLDSFIRLLKSINNAKIKLKNNNNNEFDRKLISELIDEAYESIDNEIPHLINSIYSIDELEKLKKYVSLSQKNDGKLKNISQINKEIDAKISAIKAKEHKAKIKKLTIIFSIIGVILAIILTSVFVNLGIKIHDKNVHSFTKINVAVTDKINISQDDFQTNFKFNITINNKTSLLVYGVEANLNIYDKNDSLITETVLNANGNIKPNNSSKWELTYKMPTDEFATKLWSSDLNDLHIKFKINAVSFEDGNYFYDDSKYFDAN